MIEKPLIDSELYAPLIDLSARKSEELKEINQKTIKLFQSETFINNMSRLYGAVSDALVTYDKIWESSKAISEAFLRIEKQYKTVIGSIDHFSESFCNALEKIHTVTLLTLSQHYETTMIQELTKNFSQANYSALSSIINQCMARERIQASDVAFIKSAKIISVLDDQLVYPRGIKSSIKELNVSTAREIADNKELTYNTISNLFIGNDTDLNSKELNIISAGKSVFCYSTGNEEFVTEIELISFMAVLAKQYGVGLLNNTGKKIYTWLRNQFSRNLFLDFDKEYFFHSRARNKEVMPYIPDQMIRAPYGAPGAGRFNLTGVAHYYFSDTQNGAEVEVKKHINPNQMIPQTAKIKPVKPIKLLDLSGALQRGAAFLKMIRYQVSDPDCKMPREYLIPCFIADCCKQIGFEGIKYYGSKEYSNYVSWDDGYFTFVSMC